MAHFEPPINWTDFEDIAMKLHERFGNEFGESKIYRVRFTELLDWVLQQPQDARLVVSDAPLARGVMEGIARHGLY